MTTTRLYQSTDSGAPVLTGQVDSLINLLKTCLVGTAGVAYGSGPTEKTAAGWSNPYDDPTNHITVLRADPAFGLGAYLRILDDGTGTSATAAQAHFNVYSSMSAISTGTDQTPASITGYPGARVEKSAAANGTAVPWIIVADERTVYFSTQVTTNGRWVVYGAGDYDSFVPGFAYAIFAAGGISSDASSAFGTVATSWTGASGRIMLMRDYTGASGVVTRSIASGHLGLSTNTWGNASFPSPNAALANAVVSSPAVIGSAIGLIGRFRGLYVPQVNVNSLTRPSLIAGPAAGSSLILLGQGNAFNTSGTSFNGGLLIEAALPWE